MKGQSAGGSVGARLGTGVIPMSRFASFPVRFLQACAFVMVMLSIGGNYLFGMGDRWWSGLLTQTGGTWLLIAIGWQLVWYAVQWGCLQRFAQFWWLYLLALALSVIPAFIGYNDIVFPALAIGVGVQLLHVQVFGAVTLLFNDILPEKILGK